MVNVMRAEVCTIEFVIVVAILNLITLAAVVVATKSHTVVEPA